MDEIHRRFNGDTESKAHGKGRGGGCGDTVPSWRWIEGKMAISTIAGWRPSSLPISIAAFHLSFPDHMFVPNHIKCRKDPVRAVTGYAHSAHMNYASYNVLSMRFLGITYRKGRVMFEVNQPHAKAHRKVRYWYW